MSACLKRNLPLLQVLQRSKPAFVKLLLKGASPELTKALCECALNILKGNVKISASQKKKLSRYKKHLRLLVKKKTSLKKRKQLLQKGGFIGALLTPILSVLGSLLSGTR